MSSDIIASIQGEFGSNYSAFAIFTVTLYEHLITIDQEACVVWKRKTTGATILFLLNRYTTLAFGVVCLLTIFSYDTAASCEAVLVLTYITQYTLSAVSAVFSALRAYAISNRSWCPALITLALGSVPVILDIYFAIRTSSGILFAFPVLGNVCTDMPYVSYTTYEILLITARTCAILSDMIVLVITWYNTYKIKSDAVQINMTASLVTLVLRDGTFYFLSLLLLNVLQVVLFVTNVYGDISNFNALISSILISRFMLNLRQIDHSTDHDLYSQHSSSMQSQHIRTIQSWMSDVRFTHTLVGNMGEPLTHGSFMMSTALTYASEAENPGILEVSRASKASVPDIMTLGE